ncbi:MAG: tol-pal system protein YbgF [Rhodospirillaceae bacterium]|nr:tol-pal system protein YbgF [Rhodospirillaceae bacterium]
MTNWGIARLRKGTWVCVFAVCGVFSAVGFAQAQDAGSLSSRLERVERDLTVLQRQAYRDQAAGSGGGDGALSSDSSASLFVRIGQLEEQIRDLTGQIEELSYKIEKNRQNMERMLADTDFRFQALEKGVTAPPESGVEPQPGQPAAPLGQTVPSSKSAVAPAQTTAQDKTGETAEDAYRKARGLLLKADYPAAEVAFKSFLKVHGDSDFAGNAQYWLGETYYVRGQFEQAAVAFADGYKKFRKGTKAPDSLFKLGFSMRKLNQSEKACAAFNQLLKEYPSASKAVLDLARKTRSELKCR